MSAIVVVLFPVIASIDNACTYHYILGERYRLDQKSSTVTLNFWFDIESYDRCEFTDALQIRLITIL
jgi:hypothetical protein